MAHTYVVSTNTAIGDNATLTGTVDGIPVTVNYSVSATTGFSVTQAKNFIAPLMLAQAIPPTAVTVVALPVGTFTQ